jgi:hypothetical protein
MSNANLNRSYQFTHSFIGVLEGGVSNDDESSAALPPWTMLIHNYHCKRGESEKSCRLNYSPSEFSKVVASEDASSTLLIKQKTAFSNKSVEENTYVRNQTTYRTTFMKSTLALITLFVVPSGK